jgi:peroxiredoxin
LNLKKRIRELFGGDQMSILSPGKTAPLISLKTLDGGSASLQDALKKGPVVAAFFKVSCPTCQFAAPFLERLYETYGGDNFTLWGISQDDAADTREFCQEFDVDFPILLENSGYALSNQYGITTVPSIFVINPNGKIQTVSEGFSKADLEEIAAVGAQAKGIKTSPLFKPSEHVPAVKPG